MQIVALKQAISRLSLPLASVIFLGESHLRREILPIRNRQVMGSTPIVGLFLILKHLQKKNKAKISMFSYDDATLMPL
jgi:hypothetical protein